MRDVTCPHCLAALTIPANAEPTIRCPECDGTFEQGEPPSLRQLAKAVRPEIGTRWGVAIAPHHVEPNVDADIVNLTGALAENASVRMPLNSLSPTALDVEAEPAPFGRPIRNGRLGFYVGVASGLAAAAVLAVASLRHTPTHQTVSSSPAAANQPAIAMPALPVVDVPPAPPQQIAEVTPVHSQKRVAATPQLGQPRVARPATAAPAPAASAAPTRDEQKTEGPVFDRDAAMRAIAAVDLKACHDPAVGAGTTGVAITFAPDGRVSLAVLEGPPVFNGTPVARCVISRMRNVRVAPFAGDKVTVHMKAAVQ